MSTVLFLPITAISDSAAMTPWNRLIRFATGGKTHYGEPIDVGALEDLQKAVASGSVRAKVIAAPSGIFGPDVVVTEEILPVEKLLCPLDRRDVPAIRCIGLNYRKHSEAVMQTVMAVDKASLWLTSPASPSPCDSASNSH